MTPLKARQLEAESIGEPRPAQGEATSIWQWPGKSKTFAATAPGAQLVISSLLNVKNPGCFSQEPALVRPNQGISLSSSQINCPKHQPGGAGPASRGAPDPAPAGHLTQRSSALSLPRVLCPRSQGAAPTCSPRLVLKHSLKSSLACAAVWVFPLLGPAGSLP